MYRGTDKEEVEILLGTPALFIKKEKING